MGAQLETLLRTLLYEGYALYPYTPDATKNATPTPFGIVYPPAHAAQNPSAFDHLRLAGVAHAGDQSTLTAEIRFLQASAGGRRHEAVERHVRLGPVPLARLLTAPVTRKFGFGVLEGRLRLAADHLGGDLFRLALCVHNATPMDGEDHGRAEALRHSLLSTHPLIRIEGGRFASPLERAGPVGEAVAGCAPVNTYPVLATDDDDVLLGAAIVLPDHPQLAPESTGDLFDGTEIEEALLLHVLALSDAERAQIASHDPAVRDMIARAAAAAPGDLLALHGRTVLSEPGQRETRG